jgi:hypothetical protein
MVAGGSPTVSDGGWDLSQLEARVRRLEAWMSTVQGTRPVPQVEVPDVAGWEARCREAGASEQAIAEARANHGEDPARHVEILAELAEEDTLAGRLKRSGLERWQG